MRAIGEWNPSDPPRRPAEGRAYAILQFVLLPAIFVLQATVPTTTEAAWGLVRAAGYEATPRDRAGYSADLNREGMRAYAALSKVRGDEAKGTSDTFPYLSVSMEIATPNELDPDEVDAWKANNLQSTIAFFQPHLGRTATVWRSIPLESQTLLKTYLDAFWTDAKAFAAHYDALFAPAREVDGANLRFPDEILLKRADPTSLRRVFRSWGWGTPKRADIAYRGWAEPFVVKGRLLWANGIRGEADEPRRFRIERLTEKGQRGGLDVTKLPEGTFYDGAFHRREDSITIDLRAGLPLRDLRRRIEAFAEKTPAP